MGLRNNMIKLLSGLCSIIGVREEAVLNILYQLPVFRFVKTSEKVDMGVAGYLATLLLYLLTLCG
jgi:hypothetical protein